MAGGEAIVAVAGAATGLLACADKAPERRPPGICMSFTFLPGPLGAAEILATLAAAAAPRPARLADHALHVDPDTLAVALTPQPGGAAAGVLVADPEGRAAWVLAAMGGQARRLELATDAGPVPAQVFVAEAGPAEDGADDPDLLPALAEALPEILHHRGRTGAEDMPLVLGPIAVRARARLRGARSRLPVALRTDRSPGDVAAETRGFGYSFFFAVEDHVLRHRRFDGAMSRPVGRAVLASGDAATVLPFDPRRGTVLLIEQFRAGAFARRDPNPWVIETIAGRCDRLEPPEATARREAREEAGVEIGRLERIAGYYASPGISAEFITAFVGEADLAAAGGVHGLASEDEDIRTLVVPLEAAVAAMRSGEINNAPLLVSLLWLELHHARLAADWTG